MKILIFFSRIALICNICFLLAEILRYRDTVGQHPALSTVIVLGYAAFFLNLLLAITILILFLSKNSGLKTLPRWLLITNFLFLIAQVFIVTG